MVRSTLSFALALLALPFLARTGFCCTNPPCNATSAAVCSTTSRTVPFDGTNPTVTGLDVSITNASSGCPPPVNLNVTITVTETDAFGDATFSFPGLFSTGSLVIPSLSSATDVLCVRLPAGAPAGTRTFQITLTGNFPTRICTARLDVSAEVTLEELSGIVCLTAGSLTQKIYRITNLTPVARSVSLTVTSIQDASSNGTEDHFDIRFCGDPPGGQQPGDPNPPVITKIVSIPAGVGSFTDVCVDTESYPACEEGSNCKYELVSTDQSSGNQAFASSTYTVILTGWIKKGGGGNNFITANNGTENFFPGLPGVIGSGANPNMYWRCFPGQTLWNNSTGIGLQGWQQVVETHAPAPAQLAGVPLQFFVQDPGNTCLLSAAIGSGFPPNKTALAASTNTLGAFYWYSSVPCTAPFAWWFSFTGSAAPFATASGTGQNLLIGWQDQNNTSTFSFSYTLGSGNETSASRSRSYASLHAGGFGLFQPNSSVEWGVEPIIGTMAATDLGSINPERPGDSGGAGGYSPLAGGAVAFRSFDSTDAGNGTLAVVVSTILFPGGAACHAPGFPLFGNNVPANLDPLVITLLGLPFTGGSYSPASAVGPFWNPNAGWTPGGESVSPALPLSAGTLGLTLCPATVGVNLAGGPLIRSMSNGSEVVVH